jgi:hypothetical protein
MSLLGHANSWFPGRGRRPAQPAAEQPETARELEPA